uniref:Uncharacterized protein n=1 Tax=Meloidogyne enterolobii TaxID=390850 RepID=A0A6V7XGX7_MELEN|nr:unnamed protein product [Meloidogyne enterolobii]
MDYYSFNIDETECSSYNNNTHLVRQFNFFQFSSSQVLETFRTIFTDSWSIVIQGTTIHLLRQHLNLTEMRMNKPIDSLKQALIDRLLQNGKFDLILHKAQKHANKFIFHVPKNLQIVDEIQEDVPDDEDDLWKRIEEMEQNIIFLRVKIQQIKKRQKNAKFYEEFLSTFD